MSATCGSRSDRREASAATAVVLELAAGTGIWTRHLLRGEVARRRRLSDGREFDIVKRFWEPQELEREVAAVGWRLSVRTTANGYFISASGTKAR